MLSAVRIAQAGSRVPKRALIVAGQRHAAVQAVKAKKPILSRGIQSIAQTDRVCALCLLHFSLLWHAN